MTVAFLVGAALAMTGCKKEDPTPANTDNPGGEETVENVFSGTSWVCHLENSLVQQGIQMNIYYDASLDFLDDVNAEIFQDLYIEVPAYPAASQSINQTDAFTYTFTPDSLFLLATYVDETTGDTIEEVTGAVYDKEAQTITMDFDDADMEQVMGTSVVVFTPRQGSAKCRSTATETRAVESVWQRLTEKARETLRQ